MDETAVRKTATKDELRREIATLRRIGGQMCNVCWNFGHNSIEIRTRDRETMKELADEWDAVDRAEPA
jgi:hypothetical protein